MPLTMTKQFSFCYGHHLPKYNGKCVRQHGHNSILEVTVAASEGGPEYLYPSMIMDFTELKAVVQPIIEKVDHFNLNDKLGADCSPPTCENLTMWFVREIQKELGGRAVLMKIRCSETPTSWVEWTAHDD